MSVLFVIQSNICYSLSRVYTGLGSSKVSIYIFSLFLYMLSPSNVFSWLVGFDALKKRCRRVGSPFISDARKPCVILNIYYLYMYIHRKGRSWSVLIFSVFSQVCIICPKSQRVSGYGTCACFKLNKVKEDKLGARLPGCSSFMISEQR